MIVSEDERLLIKAINDKPYDDTVRLVYADYLDETDDRRNHARAAFIRAQIALHNGDTTQLGLTQALFAKYGRDLLPTPLDDFGLMCRTPGTSLRIHGKHGPSSQESRAYFVRGLVGRIRVPMTDWVANHRTYRKNHPIVEVDMKHGPPALINSTLPSGTNDVRYVWFVEANANPLCEPTLIRYAARLGYRRAAATLFRKMWPTLTCVYNHQSAILFHNTTVPPEYNDAEETQEE